MNIQEKHGLPFVEVTIVFRGKSLKLKNVLLDTGSASTIFKADLVSEIGAIPEGDDIVDTIRGVGGIEYVYTKLLDSVHFDDVIIKEFQVEIGSMDYGMDIEGIIGFDFMKKAGVTIEILTMQVKAECKNTPII